MIRSPSTSDIEEMCDWAELQAIRSPRHVCSQGDLIKYLGFDDNYEDYQDDPNMMESERDEAKANDILGVASKRASILGNLYPFTISSNSQLKFHPIKATTKPSRSEAYLFCLLFSGLDSRHITSDARHFFEIESNQALSHFFGGNVFHFGWTKHNAAMGKADERIRKFCEFAKQGWKPKSDLEKRVKERNDLGIDTIILKPFPDSRENSLMVVAQCASGLDWSRKLETSAISLLIDCFDSHPTGPIINSFCTGFHIPEKVWRESALRHRGVIIDRLRFALAKNGSLSHATSRKWMQTVVKKIKNHSEN